MLISEDIVNKVKVDSLRTTLNKYANIRDIDSDAYRELCAEYRKAVDDKNNDLAEKLYELMYNIQKKKKRVNISHSSNRHSFWKYIKHKGRHNIFSTKDVARDFRLSIHDSEQMIKDAVDHKLIYKDGPTTYRMRNAKSINSQDISTYLNHGNRRVSNKEKGQHILSEVEKNYRKLLKVSSMSNDEIVKRMDDLSTKRELLDHKRNNERIAKKRNSKSINWEKDARKMQNTKSERSYESVNGGNSFKKESVDPDEKDKTKKRNLQLGAMKQFMDFYGLED